MSDRRIDELPVKSAAQLALTDFLIGHGDGAPAAFRSELDDVLDFLGPAFLNRFSDDIVGEVVASAGTAAEGYVRWADGTQIAWTTVQTGAINNAHGSLYISAIVGAQSWPASFFGDPPKVVSQTLSDSGNAPRWHGHGTGWGTTSTTPGVWAIAGVSTANTATIRMVGIGRWKA